MAEYLDYTGLTYFKNKLDQSYNSKYVPQGVTINGVALNSSNITINAVDSTARIPVSQKGVANGVATLDANAKIPSSQLPSYVDDVKEYADLSSFPTSGEDDKIYVAEDTGSIYRWSGSQYIQINSSVSNAESAIKDGNGNTITSTYATKTELSTKVPASVGSATKPVYTDSNGVITACTYELNKTVPSNAVFTDTKVTNTKGNTTKFYLTGTTSASTNTGTQYFDSTVYVSTTEGELVANKFTGALNGTASKATADASGNTITTTYATKTENSNKLDADSANYIKALSISGKTITYTKGDSTTGTLTTQDTTYSNFVKSGSGAAAGLVPAPSTTAGTTKYLCEDATWKVPYTHPTTAGNKHIPSGGSAGQVLIYGGSSGTASWSDVSSAITSITTTQIDALFT